MPSFQVSKGLPVQDLPRLWKALLGSMSDAVVIARFAPPDHPVVHVNRAFEEITGYTEEEVRGRDLRVLQGDDTSQSGIDRLREGLAEGRTVRALLRNYTQDGRRFWNEMVLSPVTGDDGSPQYVVGVLHDRTASLQAEEERRQVEEQLRRANQALANSVQELAQRNLQMLALNETVDHLQNCTTSREAEKAVAECVPEIFRRESGAVYLLDDRRETLSPLVVWGGSPPPDQAFPAEHCQAIRRGREFWTEASYPRVRCRHSQPVAGVRELCLALRSHGTALGLLHLRVKVEDGIEEIKEIDENEIKASVLRFAINVAEQIALGLSNIRLRERLHTQAVEDPLTGLYNRRFFKDALERELRRAIRRDSPLSLLMLDLDHFKRVNDRWGHEAGDRLLQRLARLLRTSVRTEDVVVRYGGEEFMMLLPDTELEEAVQLAERLRESFREQESCHQPPDAPPVTLSAGVAARPDSGHTAEALLRAADAALYRAKRRGRDRVETGASPGGSPGFR